MTSKRSYPDIFECLDCGELWKLAYAPGHECPECASNNIKQFEDENDELAKAQDEIKEWAYKYDKAQAEIERLNERYRLIELANKEWTRNDAVTFGKLYKEQDRLEAALKQYADEANANSHIAREALKPKEEKPFVGAVEVDRKEK